MGGCASKPRDLDVNEPAPALDNTESDTQLAQENNGGEETKTEEPLVDTSEPKGELAEAVEAPETKTDETETETEAAAEVAVASEPEKEEAKLSTDNEAHHNSEDESDAPLVTI